jgi:hypothetical protein
MQRAGGAVVVIEVEAHELAATQAAAVQQGEDRDPQLLAVRTVARGGGAPQRRHLLLIKTPRNPAVRGDLGSLHPAQLVAAPQAAAHQEIPHAPHHAQRAVNRGLGAKVRAARQIRDVQVR